ncbi:hypothetical protein B0H67DRAFT_581288 [Lasiosphaeris hirsuta]|uniref:Secreted protein n=1 Tax=Lasiosphaeris hirsuta TaxID=260670 RepID=A0AA40DXW0_9PEZI|nr:hypothetical protein B0H67DRAFT_581288 [Lasiosphaeris hirsuta]
MKRPNKNLYHRVLFFLISVDPLFGHCMQLFRCKDGSTFPKLTERPGERRTILYCRLSWIQTISPSAVETNIDLVEANILRGWGCCLSKVRSLYPVPLGPGQCWLAAWANRCAC